MINVINKINKYLNNTGYMGTYEYTLYVKADNLTLFEYKANLEEEKINSFTSVKKEEQDTQKLIQQYETDLLHGQFDRPK